MEKVQTKAFRFSPAVMRSANAVVLMWHIDIPKAADVVMKYYEPLKIRGKKQDGGVT